MFKDYSPIKNKVEKIRESRDGSRFRTWDFLWHAINSHLMNVYEDENLADITKSFASGSVPGAPAFKGKRKKSKTPNKKPGGAAGVVQGAPFNKKGGGPPPKGPKAVPKDATAIAMAKKHEERTLQEKKLIACKFEVMNNCKAGNQCEYSHAKAKIDAARAKLQKKTPATPAPPAPAPVKPGRQPSPKADPKGKNQNHPPPPTKPTGAAVAPRRTRSRGGRGSGNNAAVAGVAAALGLVPEGEQQQQ